jgi:hypothetical protein
MGPPNCSSAGAWGTISRRTAAQEVWALVRAAGFGQDAALYLTAFTGLRAGELLALQRLTAPLSTGSGCWQRVERRLAWRVWVVLRRFTAIELPVVAHDADRAVT